jgi:hypothetical protein
MIVAAALIRVMDVVGFGLAVAFVVVLVVGLNSRD